MNIFHCVQPFVRLLKVFGLFPVTFNVNDKVKTNKLKVIDFLAFAVILFILSSSFTLILKSGLMRNLWNVALMVDCASILIMVLHQWYKRHSLKEFIDNLSVFDEKVIYQASSTTSSNCFYFQTKHFRMKLDFKRQRNIIVMLSTFVLLITILETVGIPTAYYLLGHLRFDFLVPSFGFVQSFMVLFMLQFIFASLALRQRFKQLNDYLR